VDSEWTLPKPVIIENLYRPDGACGHEMITVKCDDIRSITTKSLKVNADKIIDDIKKRKIPRFR
jgi:hypothetical protein